MTAISFRNTSLFQDLVGTVPEAKLQPAPVPVLPEWVNDSFAAQSAQKMMRQIGHTAVGRAVNDVLQDPFLFLNKLGVGGLRGSIASGSAAYIGRFLPSRLLGTVLGGVVGATVGVGQAMMTFPGRGPVVAGAIHGLVAGASAGNVAVLNKQLHQSGRIDTADQLW